MRERFRLNGHVAVTVALALSASCGSPSSDADAGADAGPPVVHAEAHWRVRCDADHSCTGYADHAVLGFDGDGTLDITCRVVETATTRTLTFMASQGSDYWLALQSADFPRAGGTPTTTRCGVIFLEESVGYAGACGGETPSETQPCRLEVVFTRDTDGHSLITGNVFCVGASPLFATRPDRELTSTGEGPGAASAPATFALRDCPGYVPD